MSVPIFISHSSKDRKPYAARWSVADSHVGFRRATSEPRIIRKQFLQQLKVPEL